MKTLQVLAGVGLIVGCVTAFPVVGAAAENKEVSKPAVPAPVAAKPIDDYSWVRGVNYGVFVPLDVLKKELGYGRRVNLNAIRFWLSYHGWKANPVVYTNRLREVVCTAKACGYKSMPILFNGNLASAKEFDGAERARQEQYIKDITAVCAGTDGILMWDVMNEPDCANHLIDDATTPEERKLMTKKLWDWLRDQCRLVKKYDPKTPITVGNTIASTIEETVKEVDVLSFHDYSTTSARRGKNYDLAQQLGKKYGKAVLQTETGCYARANPYDVVLKECQDRKMGWFLFCLMVRACPRFHGIFYEDGTVRDPAAIAAMMGCYRNRDATKIVVPYANREHQAEYAIAAIKKAMKDLRSNGFENDRFDAKAILDACETAAYLLEAAELVPMVVPPTAKINAWRKMAKPPIDEIRPFAFELTETLRRTCLIID